MPNATGYLSHANARFQQLDVCLNWNIHKEQKLVMEFAENSTDKDGT